MTFAAAVSGTDDPNKLTRGYMESAWALYTDEKKAWMLGTCDKADFAEAMMSADTNYFKNTIGCLEAGLANCSNNSNCMRSLPQGSTPGAVCMARSYVTYEQRTTRLAIDSTGYIQGIKSLIYQCGLIRSEGACNGAEMVCGDNPSLNVITSGGSPVLPPPPTSSQRAVSVMISVSLLFTALSLIILRVC